MSYSQKNNLNKALKIVRHPIFISHYNNKTKKTIKIELLKHLNIAKQQMQLLKNLLY